MDTLRGSTAKVETKRKLTNIGQLVLWVELNIADSVLTWAVLNMGGAEIGLSYRIMGSMLWVTIGKYFGVALVPLVLYRYKRLRWLKWFNLYMVGVVIWNLIQFASGCLG